MFKDMLKYLTGQGTSNDVLNPDHIAPKPVSNTTDLQHQIPKPTITRPSLIVKGEVPTISIVNQCSVLTDSQVESGVAAAQIQIDRDFSPIWGLSANLVFVPKGKIPALNSWVVQVLDTSDQVGALGYHDMTNAGLPAGKIFAKDDAKYGLSWSVTLTHEILEMVADPRIDTCVFAQDSNTTGYLYAMEVCLTGDTKIPLLDGTTPCISELVGRDEFWVYSVNDSAEIKAGKGHSARLTRKNAPIIKLTLDDGSFVRLTADHKVMLRNGTYVEASKLEAGTSLMPLYRRESPISNNIKNKSQTYEQVFSPKDQDWKFTHRIVESRCPKGYVRHHKDFNRFNNSPENIVLMKSEDHIQLHAKHVVEVTRPAREALLASGKHPFHRPRTEKQREKAKVTMIEWNKSEQHKIMARDHAIESNAINYIWSNESGVAKMKNLNGKRMTTLNHTSEHKEMLREVFDTPEFKKASSNNAKLQNHLRWHVARDKTSDNCALCFNNHKVLSVEECGFEDVYDLSVDKYHNFALDIGIFVHNCDSVEDDSYGYMINGVLVTDFVTPAFFEVGRTGVKFDFRGVLPAPLSIATGGYLSVFPVNATTQGWTQQTGAEGIGKRLASKGPYSRKERRTHPPFK